MIVIEEAQDLVKATVYAQLTLADYRELERAVTTELKNAPKVKLLLDLSNMAAFTLDVAWEDLKFTKAHAHDFQRIAVVADSQWHSWTGWLATAFTDAEIETFDSLADANAWLAE
jgi:hypothetical protein